MIIFAPFCLIFDRNFDFKTRRGSWKKFLMSAASMSQCTVGPCFGLYLKNRRKTEFMQQREW